MELEKKERQRGRHRQSSHSAHFHQVVRHMLLRHMQKFEIGYQTLANAIIEIDNRSSEVISADVAADSLVWEDIRDIVKRARWVSDLKMRPILTYLENKEPVLFRDLKNTEFQERVGEAFSEFYIPPPFSSGTYANSEIKQRLKLHDAYMLWTDHGTSKPGFRGYAQPKRVGRYLVLREAEGFPFLLAHEFSIAESENARRDGDSMTNLYAGFCMPSPDFIVIHLRGYKYRNFRTLVFGDHHQDTFKVAEFHMPKSGERKAENLKKKRALIGPYECVRLRENDPMRHVIFDYIENIDRGV